MGGEFEAVGPAWVRGSAVRTCWTHRSWPGRRSHLGVEWPRLARGIADTCIHVRTCTLARMHALSCSSQPAERERYGECLLAGVALDRPREHGAHGANRHHACPLWRFVATRQHRTMVAHTPTVHVFCL